MKLIINEDEPQLRAIFGMVSRKLGHEVFECNGYDQTIACVGAVPDADAVLSDLDGSEGIRLARYMREHYPRIQIFLMSGRLPQKEERAVIGSTHGFFQKPFALDEVLAEMAKSRSQAA